MKHWHLLTKTVRIYRRWKGGNWESESAVAKARANAGLKADIYLRFGLTQTADKLPDAYLNLLDEQYVSIGIFLCILDRDVEKDKCG